MLNCENYRIHENNPHYTRGTKMPKIIEDKSKHLCDVSHMNFQGAHNYLNTNIRNDLDSTPQDFNKLLKYL